MSAINERLLQLQKTCGDLTDRLDQERLISSRLGEAVERYSKMIADYEHALKAITKVRYGTELPITEDDEHSNNEIRARWFEEDQCVAREVLKKWENR